MPVCEKVVRSHHPLIFDYMNLSRVRKNQIPKHRWHIFGPNAENIKRAQLVWFILFYVIYDMIWLKLNILFKKKIYKIQCNYNNNGIAFKSQSSLELIAVCVGKYGNSTLHHDQYYNHRIKTSTMTHFSVFIIFGHCFTKFIISNPTESNDLWVAENWEHK